MRLTRCPRCRAEDISADAHPTRLLQNGQDLPVFVCRGCYRPAELEFRIACETNGISYAPLGIRESLRLLRDFYRARLAEPQQDEEGHDLGRERVGEALADVERRLAITLA